jgi:transketolase
LLPQLNELPGPVYLRLDRKPGPALPTRTPRPVLGRIETLVTGRDVVLLACGPQPIAAALQAQLRLAEQGVAAAVLQVHTLSPFDRSTLLRAAEPASLVVSVEEHWAVGGLGSAVAEVLSERLPRPLIRVGMPATFVSIVGSQQEILDHYGINATGITNQVLAALHRLDTRPNHPFPEGEPDDHAVSRV